MQYTTWKQHYLASRIVEAVSRASNVPWPVLLCHQRKSVLTSTALGVCCVLSWDEGLHPRIMAQAIQRTRANVINQTRKYRNYIKAGDKQTIEMYEKAKRLLATGSEPQQ